MITLYYFEKRSKIDNCPIETTETFDSEDKAREAMLSKFAHKLYDYREFNIHYNISTHIGDNFASFYFQTLGVEVSVRYR